MSHLVVMPEADWQAALDSVRAKAQMTDLIKSGELSAIIDAIESGVPNTSAVASGVYVHVSGSSSSEISISHGLGVTPDIVVIVQRPFLSGSTRTFHSQYIRGNKTYVEYTSSSGITITAVTPSSSANATSFPLVASYNYQLKSGYEYLWWAFVIESE